MITSLPEEVLIEVLVKMGRYKIDDEVFKEAERLYDEKIAQRQKSKQKSKLKKDKYENKKQVLHC